MRGAAFKWAVALIIATSAASSTLAQQSRSIPPVPLGALDLMFGRRAYPAEALKAHAEGRVDALLEIDSEGKATACTVKGSSGNASLDAKT